MTRAEALKAARQEVTVRPTVHGNSWTVATNRAHPKDKKADRQETRQWCKTHAEARAFRATRVVTRALVYLGLDEPAAQGLAIQHAGTPAQRISAAYKAWWLLAERQRNPMLPFMEGEE